MASIQIYSISAQNGAKIKITPMSCSRWESAHRNRSILSASKDSEGSEHMLEIGKDLFAAFDQFELDDISYMHKVDRHHEQNILSEESLKERVLERPVSVEEDVSRRIELEHLFGLIAELPAIQRQRLILYYFGGYTYEKIAEMEGCTKRAVKFSIDIALRKLKEKM